MKSENLQTLPVLQLGYWQLRGRAQVPRLLLEYLSMPYQNIFFANITEWQKFKQRHQKEHPLLDLPFLIDGDVIISEAVPICNYIIKKSKEKDILGKNLKDLSILNMYTWSIDNLGLALVKLCWMPGRPQRIEQVKARFWELNVKEQVERLEKFASYKPWMLGYLSLFDFSIYQLVHYISIIFPKQIKDYKKLLEIEKKVGSLPQIKAYQSSEDAIKVFLPESTLKKER